MNGSAAANLNSLPIMPLASLSSGIPGMSIQTIDRSSLPLLQVPRKHLNQSLPQGYHSYKSSSESPFSMRGSKTSTHKHNYVVSTNTIKLDKIDEATFKSRTGAASGAAVVNQPPAQTSANLSNTTMIPLASSNRMKNRSISPKISDKQQLKNSLNLRNGQFGAPSSATATGTGGSQSALNTSKSFKISLNLSPNEKATLSRTVNVQKLRSAVNSNSQHGVGDSTLNPRSGGGFSHSHSMSKSAYSGSSTPFIGTSNVLASIPEQPKFLISSSSSSANNNNQLSGTPLMTSSVPKPFGSHPSLALKGTLSQVAVPMPSTKSESVNHSDNRVLPAKKHFVINASSSNMLGSLSTNSNTTSNANFAIQSQNINGHSESGTASTIPYKFYVGGGNNGNRIKRLLRKRDWVECSDPASPFVNFKWQQSTRGYKYDKLVDNNNNNGMFKQAVNHFEHHKEISNKQYLVKNLTAFAESMKQNVFDITPVTYVIDFHDENCDLILNNFLKFFEMNMPLHLKKKQQQQQQQLQLQQSQSQNSQTSNSNSGASSQGKGNEIRRILRTYQTQYGQSGAEKLFNYFYTRWSLQETFLDANESTYMWLLKPTFLNRGRGIHVFNSLSALEKLIVDYTDGFEEKSLKKPKEEDAAAATVTPAMTSSMVSSAEKISKKPETNGSDKENNESLAQNKSKPTTAVASVTTPAMNSSSLPSINVSPTKAATFSGNRIGQKKEEMVPNKNAKGAAGGANATAAQGSNNGPFILKASQFVVQKYIEKPLLINKRKFDIRVWAMVTHNMDVYFFREGYMRLSSSEFSTDEKQLDNLFIHLTNNAIQKYSESYGTFENGNMWNLNQLWAFMETFQSGGSNFSTRSGSEAAAGANSAESSGASRKTAKQYKKKIMQKMKDIIWLTFSSVKKKLNSNDRKYTFEIFGFDFLLDDDLNTWLIEVNTNPAIEECSLLMQTLVPRALDDAFKLTLDLIFPPKKVKPAATTAATNANSNTTTATNLNHDKTSTSENNTSESTTPSAVSGENSTASHPAPAEVPSNQEPEFYPVPGYEDNVNIWELLGNLRDTSNMQTKKKFKSIK